MSRIKNAVALSDLHLGSEQSFLHAAAPEFTQNRTVVLSLLQKLGARDELILNGDFLELALASLNEVYKDVAAFFALLTEAAIYQRIVYLPGNHDHHFWRNLAEHVYVDGKICQQESPPNFEEYPFCFVDERFSSRDDKLPCRIILTELWPSEKAAPEMVVKYPHHLVKVVEDGIVKQNYFFTHGHFLEELFKPMENIIHAEHLEELEAFNNIWLESFNYHLGHAGKLTNHAKRLLQCYEKGGREEKKTVKQLLNNAYKLLKKKLKLSWPLTWIIKGGFVYLVKKIPVDKKSDMFGEQLNKRLFDAITSYLKNFVIGRYRKGMAKDYFFKVDADIPKPFVFVYGHTHRPIFATEREKAKVEIDGEEYPLANTGGWTCSEVDETDHSMDAGILVIDAGGWRWESLAGQLRRPTPPNKATVTATAREF